MQHALQRDRLPNATEAETLQSTANVSRPGCFLGKRRACHMRYIGCARTRLSISPKKSLAIGKEQSRQRKNNEQYKQRAQRPARSGVHTVQHTL